MTKNTLKPMELEVWKDDFGLPSVDSSCLRIMVYAKFSGAPLQYKKTNNPWKSPTGELPVLKCDGQKYTKFVDVVKCLENKNYNCDQDIEGKKSDVMAFTHLIENELKPALLYLWWVDAKNYVDVTRPWYARALPFPMNYFWPGRKQTAICEQIRSLYATNDTMKPDDNMIENQVYKQAMDCITKLSYRLGEKHYFIGTSGTSLDSMAFAYLAPILKVNFPVNPLLNHLKQCSNLVGFIDRIISDHFRSTAAQKVQKDEKKEPSEFRTRDKVFSAVFASVSMVLYFCYLISGSDGDSGSGLEPFRRRMKEIKRKG